jgi:hypothetical protein
MFGNGIHAALQSMSNPSRPANTAALIASRSVSPTQFQILFSASR